MKGMTGSRPLLRDILRLGERDDNLLQEIPRIKERKKRIYEIL